jgi:acetate kinase
MNNAIIVLNAGSSSIKFSLFVEHKETLEPDIRGQIEGLDTQVHFVSKAPNGVVKAEKIFPDGVALGHDGALDHLISYLRMELVGNRLIGIGHRVVQVAWPTHNRCA